MKKLLEKKKKNPLLKKKNTELFKNLGSIKIFNQKKHSNDTSKNWKKKVEMVKKNNKK